VVGDEQVRVGVELAFDLDDHGVGRLADRLHGERREPVRQHGADEQPGERDWVEQVDAHVASVHAVEPGDKGAEER
jgi:hypothetical protein